MPNAQLCDRLAQGARDLLAATDGNYVDGNDVALHIGVDPNGPAVYHAFRELERQGALKLEGWR
jgi:hypothetical protein